jgi:hypothetical protein
MDEKEKFLREKNLIEKEILDQITDSITVDRSRCRGLLEGLAADTSTIQQALATTRSAYTYYQKDANARMVIKIESAIRECRKLRTAAEAEPELEKPVLAEIKKILENAKKMCNSMVAQIRSTSSTQLRGVEPLRQPHREKMISKIQIIEKSWNECHQSLIPLVTVYEEEVTAKLAVMRANILEELGDFRDVEIKRLGFDQRKQRQALINAFREHMATYDLSEHSIFEKFNWEVRSIALDVKRNWGPMNPPYLRECAEKITEVAKDAARVNSKEILSNNIIHFNLNRQVTHSLT